MTRIRFSAGYLLLLASLSFLSYCEPGLYAQSDRNCLKTVCKNSPSQVTYSSAGHQEENISDINNHMETQPGRICRQQQLTFDLTREPGRAVPTEARAQCKAAFLRETAR